MCRRKYFSSLERLRIAEDHAHQPANNSHRHLQDFLPCRPPSRSKSKTRRRLVRAESLKLQNCLAQNDADFFLSLPPKVQRSAFSHEEQTLLVGRCDLPCSRQSPLPPSRRTHHPHHQLQLPYPQARSTHTLAQDEQRFGDFHFGFNTHHALTDDDDAPYNNIAPYANPYLHHHHHHQRAPSPPRRGRTLRRRSSISELDLSPPRPSPNSPYAYADHLDADSESSLPLYLDTMSPLASQPSAATYRRTLSLTNIPLRTSTSTVHLPSESPWHQRSHSQSLSGRRSSHTPQAPVFDPEATHYRDAETRKKLQFLASPQKFDEAVEFGFPSTGGDDTLPSRYQLPQISTDARNFSRDMQSFLKDDRISFLEDNDSDNKGLESDRESVADFDSPVTPSSVGMPFRYHGRKQSSTFSSSMESNGVPLIHPVGGRLNREMTLRMTLTRPDLRADEEQLYGWQAQGPRPIKDDPFALEDLPLSDDMNGTKGPFYVKPKPHGNLVSRLFKRSSKKSK